MYTLVQGITLRGLDGWQVSVEADVQPGLPCVDIVGLPASSIREAKERVRSAVLNSGYEWPRRRMIISLRPADWRKDGTGLDLPIALAVLAASEQIPPIGQDIISLGELSLDGRVRSFRGAWTATRSACVAGAKRVIIPTDVECDAIIGFAAEVIPVVSLSDAIAAAFNKLDKHPAVIHASAPPTAREAQPDLADVRGLLTAKRALTIAAVGGHHMLLIGPPGAGKSMLAERLPSLLPPLSTEDWTAVRQVYSVANLQPPCHGLPPYRAPHHTTTVQGLLGGGSQPRPGEISLAHHGVLFLDELPEFPRSCIEGLRQPLEKGNITMGRAAYSCTFPGRFQLIAAMNPCPCGYHGSDRKPCTCGLKQINRYRARISGPILDRLDLTVWVEPTSPKEFLAVPSSTDTGSDEVRKQVILARSLRKERERICLPTEHTWNNSTSLEPQWLEAQMLTAPAARVLASSADLIGLSARGLVKTVHVARSIADLDGDAWIQESHVAEALQYRCP